MVDREIVTAIWLTAKGLILMARKKKTNLTLSDGFDKVTGKFDTAILKKMYPDARYYFILGGQGRRCTSCFFILLMINVWDKMIYVVL